MSAYVMNDDEINYIVSYFISPNHETGEGAWLRIGDEYMYLNRANAPMAAENPDG